ncbi:MAG: PspC domain-containing protein [Dehalococcoidia bacterium]|nr:hypothetical protein [Chloroflexota bacterium]MBT9162448.1 hypothetical protein [Chloroflexota bacterium]
MERRLYRSRSDRVIWGVCGGLARYLGVDPTVIRLVMVLLVFANGIGILAYIIMAIVVPLEGSKTAQPKETVRENVEEIRKTAAELGKKIRDAFGEEVEEMRKTAAEVGEEIRSTFSEEEAEAEERDRIHRRRRNFIAIILVVVGLFFLAANFNFFWWFRWDRLWPLFLVAVGLLLLVTTWRRQHG